MKDLFGNEIPEPSLQTVVTKYAPDDWVEETAPTLAADPVEFIERDQTGSWYLRELRNPDGTRDEGGLEEPITPGDLIAFNAHRSYPDVTLTVEDNGSFDVFPPFSADANCFYIDDPEAMAHSVDELVSGYGDPAYALEPGTYSLTNYHWSAKIFFEFTVMDGKPVLTRRGMES